MGKTMVKQCHNAIFMRLLYYDYIYIFIELYLILNYMLYCTYHYYIVNVEWNYIFYDYMECMGLYTCEEFIKC